jgi:glucokinase
VADEIVLKMQENVTEVKRGSVLLAADIGGTKTLLGVFDPVPARPRPIAVRSFITLDYDELPSMIYEFLACEHLKPEALRTACFGVAGPVMDDAAELTNIPWRVDARRVAAVFGLRRVTLLNDLQAMAYSVPVLHESELHPLQTGAAVRGGNIALIAAGTGLGEALLHSIDGRFVPSPSEGGHADFSARTEREIALVRDLTVRYGRADVEHVISGRGLGHTGGTLDKLESIPGWRAALSNAEMRRQLDEIGAVICAAEEPAISGR